MNLDQQVCLCFHVTRRKLVNFLRVVKPRVPSQMSECGSAGSGCGWCVPFLNQLFEQARNGEAIELELPTEEEYGTKRAGYIREGKGTPPPGATPLPS